jgi:hypothetical protein
MTLLISDTPSHFKIRSQIADEIEQRAWALLNSPSGFNGYTADEIRTWGRDRYSISRNTVGVAICRARDEVVEREVDTTLRLEERCRAIRRLGFNKGAFRRVESLIIRDMRLRWLAQPRAPQHPATPQYDGHGRADRAAASAVDFCNEANERREDVMRWGEGAPR